MSKRTRRAEMARDLAAVQAHPDGWDRPPVDPRAVEAETPLPPSGEWLPQGDLR